MAKVLLVVPIAHCSVYTGSGQRTVHLYRALADAHRVDVLLVPEYRSSIMVDLYPAWFEERFARADNVFLAPSTAGDGGRPHGGIPGRLARRVANALRSPADYCQVDATSAGFVKDLVRRHRHDLVAGRYLSTLARCGALEVDEVPIVLDVDDRGEKIVESRIASPTTPAMLKPLLRRQLRDVTALSDRLRARCSHLWLASDADMRELAHPSMSVLRNIPYDPEGREAAPAGEMPGPPTCLFVGVYSHRVNREGVLHFVRHGWPRVRDAVPDARLRIVGSGGWDRVKARLERSPGVEVVGAVDDVATEYARALFSVIPLFEGGGTKIKVLESLRHARTVVGHRHTMHGFDELAHMQSVLVAESDDDLAQACITLFEDPALARRLASNGARIVAQSYSFASFSRTVATDLCAVLARHRRCPAQM